MAFGMIPKREALVEYVGRLSARLAFKRPAFKRAAEKDEAGKNSPGVALTPIV